MEAAGGTRSQRRCNASVMCSWLPLLLSPVAPPSNEQTLLELKQTTRRIMANVHTQPRPIFRFTPDPTNGISARRGRVTLIRPGQTLEIHTPGIMAVTSRGVVPHLSGDHVATTDAIRWVHVPIESLHVLRYSKLYNNDAHNNTT